MRAEPGKVVNIIPPAGKPQVDQTLSRVFSQMKIWFKDHYRRRKIQPQKIVRLVERVLGAMGEHSAEVGLVLTGDSEMKKLNQRYRGINQSTDVLAFPMMKKRVSHGRRPAAGRQKKITGNWELATGQYNLLGDVVISVPTAKRQALEQRHPLEHEMSVLIIHGLLHLLGYDHERSLKDAEIMERKERQLLRTAGLSPGSIK